MNALSIILNIVLILISIVLIAVVLMQQGQRQGLGAISGGAETFFGKGKVRGLDAKLQKITKIAAVVFIVLAMATTMVVAHINNDAQEALVESLSAEDLAAVESGEAHLHDDGTVHYDEAEGEDAEAPADDAADAAPADDGAEAPADAADAAPADEGAEAPADDASAEPQAE